MTDFTTSPGEDKREKIERMFDDIAPTYDVLNHILSLGIDRSWRRKVTGMVACGHDSQSLLVLDVATGTGDLAVLIARRLPRAQIVGVDISEGMLSAGREKLEKASLTERVRLQTGDAETLCFDAGSFDIVTVAFGVRNFGDISTGLREMHRVLREGGRCYVLEFSEPTAPVFGWVYRAYFHKILPFVGRSISKNRGAYTYLPRSVDKFPVPEKFTEMLGEAGFSKVRTKKLTFGVAYIYEAVK